MIVDGVTRDAKTRTDWVLQPTTTYFRVHGDVEIGTTTTSATFGPFVPLTNGVEPTPVDPGDGSSWKYVWTGTDVDFASGNSCAAWSDTTDSLLGWVGVTHSTGTGAFAATRFSCADADVVHVYCVEQP